MYLFILENRSEDISVRIREHMQTGFIASYATDLNDHFTLYWSTIFRALSFSVLPEKAEVTTNYTYYVQTPRGPDLVTVFLSDVFFIISITTPNTKKFIYMLMNH